MNEPKYFDDDDLKVLFPEKSDAFEVEFEPQKNVPSAPPKIERTQKKLTWKFYAKFVGLFFGIFILTYVAINATSLIKQSRYFWDVKIRHQDYNLAIAAPTPVSSFNPQSQAKLLIPKLGVSAPINWNVSEDQIQDKLLSGVVHSSGTALPGQKGNIFITGHSSYYAWVSSPYKDIFSLLENLTVGDKIYIEYQGANFIYEVKDTKVVSPKEISVLDQTNDYRLTLMTCVPVGTTLNRLIITSTQISSN